MITNLIPGVGTNTITLGFSRQKVRETLGPPSSVEFRSIFSKNTYDFYEERSMFCYYDLEDLLTGMEFSPDANLWIYKHCVFKMNGGELTALLESHSRRVEQDNAGVFASDLGLSFNLDDPQDRESSGIESFLIELPTKLII